MIIHKHAYGFESRSETYSLLIQMRLEKPQFVTRAFAVLRNSRSYFFALKIATFTD